MRKRCALVLVALGLLGSGNLHGEPEKALSIKDIMQEAHRGCNSNGHNYFRLISDQLIKVAPDWAVAEQRSRDLVRMGKMLSQLPPPRGSLDSWRTFTDRYMAEAAITLEAVEQRDIAAAQKHLRLIANCRDCHMAHR